MEIQREMIVRNEAIESEKRIEFRMGINIGDVIVDGGDIFGDGVNVAARLEGIAEAGGISISRPVYDQIDGKLALSFRNLGLQKLKNIAKPVEVFAIDQINKSDDALKLDHANAAQTIKYCRAPDGVRLAYAISGSGPFLVKAGNWMNHLEYDWESPIWSHFFRGLSRERIWWFDTTREAMVCPDWDVDKLSLDAWVSDLETVVDAAGVRAFPRFSEFPKAALSLSPTQCGTRNGCRTLILYGAFALGGKKRSPAEKQIRDAMTTLIRFGWGADTPSFRQMFTLRFIPGGTHEQVDFFNELQLKTTSPDCAARYYDVCGDFDIPDILSKVKAPTLVMHVRDDLVTPLEAGRQLAAGIPGARFIVFPGRNHMFLEDEPASDRFFQEISFFLKS